MTENEAPRRRSGASQARPGNNNAEGHKRPALPLWHVDAKRELTREVALGRFRNWGGTAAAPTLHGMTVSAPDPRKTRVPHTEKPFQASIRGEQTWHPTAASARAAVESAFVAEENARREERLAASPFADPAKRDALYRALRALQ